MSSEKNEILSPQQTEAIQQEVSVIEARANELVIKTDEDAAGAADFLKQVKGVENNVISKKEEITKPLNAALKSARALFSPFEDAAARAGATIRRKLGDYQMEAERKARAKQAEIEAKLEADRAAVEAGEMSQAQAEKNEIKAEKKLEKAAVATSVDSGSTKVSFREDYVVKHINLDLLPREYLMADTVKIGKLIRAGGSINGVEVEVVKTPILR